MCFANVQTSVHGLAFHSVNNVFHRMKVLNFDKFQFTNFYTMNYAFGVILKNSLPVPRQQKVFSLVFFEKVDNLPFIFRLMIPFDLTFV